VFFSPALYFAAKREVKHIGAALRPSSIIFNFFAMSCKGFAVAVVFFALLPLFIKTKRAWDHTWAVSRTSSVFFTFFWLRSLFFQRPREGVQVVLRAL